MCIVLWYYDREDVVIMFNREEFLDRPTKELGILQKDSANLVVGGKDELQGGTWLAVNLANGLVACLTNRNILNQLTMCHRIEAFKNEVRRIFPCLMNTFMCKVQSRGALIMQLVQSREGKQDSEQVKTESSNKVKAIFGKIGRGEEIDVGALAKSAQLNRYKFLPYNLFVGSLHSKQFKVYNHYVNQIEDAPPLGSASSFSHVVGQEKLLKQRIAEGKFQALIKDSLSAPEVLVAKLFELSQDSFSSDESFFKAGYKSEAKFFIPPYKHPNGKTRGTRTTTIVICRKDQVSIHERSYD